MNTQLLCTFTSSKKIHITLKDITNNFNIIYNKIFILYNINNNNEIMCTYNISKENTNNYLENTISLHRKKETNTLYTINALNKLITIINNGVLDTNYQIDWENYKDIMLTTNEQGLKRTEIKIKDIIYINE